ncbi:MAG: DUF5789 family protein [Natronomonas sp.]
MRLPETRDLFSRELTFPINRGTVVDQIGHVELESPRGTTESIGDVLERTETDEFHSADDLFDTLMTFVGGDHIGRHRYDDRGTTTTERDEEVSF